MHSPLRAKRLDELRTAIELYDETLPDAPAAEVALDEAYAEWSATYDGQNPLFELEQSVVHPLLKRLVTPGAVVLDAGCGTGRHASFVWRLGATVIGVDVSADMLDVARRRCPSLFFALASMDRLPIASQSVDIIVCGLSLCHMDDLPLVLREFRRVIRPNGLLLISDPHARSQYFGGQGFYKNDGKGAPKYVRNRHREASEWISAALICDFSIRGCHEPAIPADAFGRHRVSTLFPDAAPAAFGGAPALWVWELRA